MKSKNRLLILVLLILSLLIQGCEDKAIKQQQEDYLPLINIHEHVQDYDNAIKFLRVMNKANVSKTVLLGSPELTLYSGRSGFAGYDENNEELLRVASDHPNRFVVFPTIYPGDEQKLEKFKSLTQRGAKGLKLYSGHYASFYDPNYPINDTGMYEVYEYCEENHIPIIFHVNPGKEDLQQQFENLLQEFPGLVVDCPHFCLSSINTDRFEHLYNNYPNLYTDVSFGFYAEAGFDRISKNPQKYKELIEKYSDRFMYGTDMVVTSHPRKTEEWIYNLTMCYRDMLEKERYHCTVGSEIDSDYNGLGLDSETLKKIYQDNPNRFWGLT